MRCVSQTRPAAGRTHRLLVALVAILLIFGTTLQLTHIHLDGAAHQDCALCQNAHNVVRPAIAPCVQATVIVVRRVPIPPARQYRQRVFSYSHWNRPPPLPAANA
jgi:hypothetical protein